MADPYKCILLFGMPGVGKGTQGRLLGQIPGFFHLATGDMFRSLDHDSDLGKRVLNYSTKGLLVPDDLTIELWQQYINEKIEAGDYNPSNDLLILDGIPRSVNQARAMAERIEVLAILHLHTQDLEAMVQRIKLRARRENRPDDADESVIRRRLQVYTEETEPVLREYNPELIVDVDAIGLPVEVLLRILETLAPLYARHFGNPLKEDKQPVGRAP